MAVLSVSVERLEVLVSTEEASSIGPIPPSCRSESDSFVRGGLETLVGRGGAAFAGGSALLVAEAGGADDEGGTAGSVPIPDGAGRNPSDTIIPANASKSSSPPPIDMRTEFLVDILLSKSLLLVSLGSIAAFQSKRTERVSARSAAPPALD